MQSNPGTLNTWLRNNGGYTSGNDLIESVVPNINKGQIRWEGTVFLFSFLLPFHFLTFSFREKPPTSCPFPPSFVSLPLSLSHSICVCLSLIPLSCVCVSLSEFCVSVSAIPLLPADFWAILLVWIHTTGSILSHDGLTLAQIRKYLQDGSTVVIGNVMEGRHFVLIVGWDDANENELLINDPGFAVTQRSYSEFVGYRIFTMLDKHSV